jgi:hypothetical protein
MMASTNANSCVRSRSVTGPLALGYGAHFGLGLFIPVRNEI